MSIHWVAWLLLSNCAIAFIEYTYRAGQYDSFWKALPYIIVPILTSQYGLFEGFSRADSLLLAAAVFSCISVVLRICVSLYIGEEINLANWIGVLSLILGTILLKIK